MGPKSNDHQVAKEPEPLSLQHVDVERLALLVANGQIELPLGLPHDELRTVIDRTRELRRQNLLRHVARCIAVDIVRSSDFKER